MNVTDPYIGSGKGFVPSDNDPLLQPILTQFHVPLCRHQANMCYMYGLILIVVKMILSKETLFWMKQMYIIDIKVRSI